MTYEPITDQEIKTNIAYFSDLRDKLVLGYREGCCGFRETMDRLRSRVIYDGLFYFLERHGIGLCITDFPKLRGTITHVKPGHLHFPAIPDGNFSLLQAYGRKSRRNLPTLLPPKQSTSFN